MSLQKGNIQTDFYNKFSELYKPYDNVKKIVLLAEYENKDQKYIITSVNELRNSFDHLMRIVSDPETLEKNFEKAKGHLYRSGYDAYEILAIAKLNEIMVIREQFSYDAIIEAYPSYHTEVIPIIKKAKEELASSRANKKIDLDNDHNNKPLDERKHFDAFERIVQELIKASDDITLYLDGIKEAENNIRSKRLKNVLFYYIILPLISGIILLYIGSKLFLCDDDSRPVKKSEIINLK